ncbi:MAG: hypothetical protein ACYSWP_15905 [Planctomycetota bacterium]|jgi:hypothetical protein
MAFTKEQNERIIATRDAIDLVLDKYKTTLMPQLVMTGDNVQHSVGIVPQKEESRIVVPKLNEAKLQGGGVK